MGPSKNFKATIRKAWVDPVWSKVISTAILAALGFVATLLYKLGQWLMTISWGDNVTPLIESLAWILNISVPLWFVLFLLVGIVLSRLIFRRFTRWASRGSFSVTSSTTVSTQTISDINEQKTQPIATEGDAVNDVKVEEPEGIKSSERTFEKIEYYVLQDSDGQYVINGAPTVFFSDRIASTFPGLSGLRIIDDPKTALSRLARFLRTPVYFEESRGFGCYVDPIWWIRGPSAMFIEQFIEASEDAVALMGRTELKIKRIAAFNSNAYYQAFIYVETEGMPPSGAYQFPPDYITEGLKESSYVFEEYGWFNGQAIDNRFHDDGYMEKDGIVSSVAGSERRRRYLTPFNFLIIPKTSPLIELRREVEVEKMLDDILSGRSTPDVLATYVQPLPKSRLDN